MFNVKFRLIKQENSQKTYLCSRKFISANYCQRWQRVFLFDGLSACACTDAI